MNCKRVAEWRCVAAAWLASFRVGVFAAEQAIAREQALQGGLEGSWSPRFRADEVLREKVLVSIVLEGVVVGVLNRSLDQTGIQVIEFSLAAWC